MSSRDEAVKVGADALDAQLIAAASSIDSAAVLDAAHKAGLIVWADELELAAYQDVNDHLWRHEATGLGDTPLYRKRDES